MNHAPLPACLGEELGCTLDQADAGVGHDQLDAAQATFLEVSQEGAPAGLVLLGAFNDPENLPKAVGIGRDRQQQRDVAHLAGPAALVHDAVEIEIGLIALDRLLPPGVDLAVDLLVEVRPRAGADPRAPKRLGDVLDPADPHAGQVHLDHRFLHRALPSPIAFDDGGLESLHPQLRHLQRHLAGLVCSLRS